MAIKQPTQGEIDAHAENEKVQAADIEAQFDATLKAFALVMLDEINTLRTAASLPVRTVAQLKTAIKNKLP